MSPRILILLLLLIAGGAWLVWPGEPSDQADSGRPARAIDASDADDLGPVGLRSRAMVRPRDEAAQDAMRRAGLRSASFMTEDWSPEEEAYEWRRKSIGDQADFGVERPRHRLREGEMDQVVKGAKIR